MILLMFVTSCALFKGQPSLIKMDKEKLLDSVKLTGEGKGRLTLNDTQYLFGVDSILNDDHDWIMAVQIPLHGEEVMILPDLRKKHVVSEEIESFEMRINREFKRLGLSKSLSSETFLREMRSLIRFTLSKDLGKKRDCAAQDEVLVCKLDGEIYRVSTSEKEFFIEKNINEEFGLQVVAKNLTESIFEQTSIKLESKRNKNAGKPSAFSMEFFW